MAKIMQDACFVHADGSVTETQVEWRPMDMTNGEMLRRQADAMGMPLRTLEDVQASMAAIKARSKGKNAGLDVAMAKLMLRHGRLRPECRAWLEKEYPQ